MHLTDSDPFRDLALRHVIEEPEAHDFLFTLGQTRQERLDDHAMLRELEPRASVLQTTSVETLIEKSYAGERYRTVIIAVFGVMASLLAAVGLYGVSVRAATRRNREIGIRLALGGTSGRVVRLLVGDAMAGVAVGLAVGIPAAVFAARFVRPYLFKVGPSDPLSFVLVGGLLVVVTAAASFLPARLAGRANPAVVLRGE